MCDNDAHVICIHPSVYSPGWLFDFVNILSVVGLSVAYFCFIFISALPSPLIFIYVFFSLSIFVDVPFLFSLVSLIPFSLIK